MGKNVRTASNKIKCTKCTLEGDQELNCFYTEVKTEDGA